MQKETVYLAGKITGDPYYHTKFFTAADKLKEAGFIVMNPALLPSEGFEYEAYIRMSTAMLDECAAACFLPDWTESNGAIYEFGRAAAKGKRIFMYAEWERNEEEKPKWVVQTRKTDKLALRCLKCGKLNVYPANSADGRECFFCKGQLKPIGYATLGGSEHDK